MFTGIVRDVAKIVWIKKYESFFQWIIELYNIDTKTLLPGSSISCNGCCLTVKSVVDSSVSVDIIQETLRCTNLGYLNRGHYINIERSVTFGEEIGGHLVSGHILMTAKICKIKICNHNFQLWIELDDLYCMKYIFCKGFICIDGVSLTVGIVKKNVFCVFLVPETISNTTMKDKIVGDLVNVEIDYFTKITVDSVERLLGI
ncbi:MAG: riboflavin synthase subunit alpha [Buchnera aphidicola (Meitanaphis elongallis)]